MEMTPTLVWSPHPLLAGAGRQLIHIPFWPAESVAAYLTRLGVPVSDRPVILALNDKIIARSDWDKAFPRDGDIITVRARVQGGGGDGGSDPLRTVLTIAVLAFAPQAAAYLSWGLGISTTAGTALALIGGSLLVDQLAPLPKPNNPGQSSSTISPTYALTGAGNRMRPFEPLPLVFGMHKIFPDLGVAPYTEFRGEDHYLYLVFNFGLADITLTDFRIGDTALTEYQGVETEESDATGNIALFPSNVDTIAGGSLTFAAGWITKTSSIEATALVVDISGVLFYAGDDGLSARGVSLEIEYRAVGAGSWLPFNDSPSTGIPAWTANHQYVQDQIIIPPIFNGHQYRRDVAGGFLPWYSPWSGSAATEPLWATTPGAFFEDGRQFERDNDLLIYEIIRGWTEAGTISVSNVYLQNNSRSPLRVSFRRNVVPGQYEVRLRRLTSDETDDRAVSQINWDALKTYQSDSVDYTGQKRLGMIIKASGQLQGSIDTFNAIASARVPAWNGSAWTTQATNNPAWLFLWFARGKTLAGRRIFGAGLPDNRIDIEGLKVFGAWCTAKNLTFNAVLDRAINCAEALQLIARAGRGAPTWASGKLGVVWDVGNQPAVAVFGMGNIKRNSFSVQYITGKLADEIVVSFINPALNWQQDTVRVPVAGTVNPERPVTVEFFGCTDRDLAGAEANLIAAAQTYRRRRITWDTDFEGLVVQRGDVVILSHDLTQWAYSGRLVAGDGITLTLDRMVPFSPFELHYIGVVFPNGYYEIFNVDYQLGSSATVTLATAWPAVDDQGNPLYTPNTDPNHPPFDYKFVFEPKATPGKKVKILDIKPLSESAIRLLATDEEDNYYAAESASYTYAPPGVFEAALPTITRVDISDTLVVVGAGYATRIEIAFDVSGAYGSAAVRAAPVGMSLAAVGQTNERRFVFTGPPSGVMDIEILARAPTGHFKAAGRYTTQYKIIGKDRLPDDVTGFTGSQNGRFVVMQWNEIADVDRDGYEIRRAPPGIADTAEAWGRGNPVTEADRGTQITSGLVPPGLWTMLIKARDTSGNKSQNAGRFDIEVTNALDIIQQHEQAPDWLGVKTNFLVHWSGKLVPDSTRAANLHSNAELFEQFVPYPFDVCSYESPEIDLGFDSDVRLWADISAQLGRGRTGIADPRLFIDYRIAAGAYDGFEAWGIGDVRAQFVKHKLTLNTATSIAFITGMNAVADSDEFTQSGEFVSALGGTAITFPEPFHVLSDFQITPEGISAYLATYGNLTKTGAIGHIWNTSAAEVAGVNARWSAKGV